MCAGVEWVPYLALLLSCPHMYTCKYNCKNIHAYTHLHTQAQTYTHTYTHTQTNKHTHIHAHTCAHYTHTYMHARTCNAHKTNTHVYVQSAATSGLVSAGLGLAATTASCFLFGVAYR
jgi:carbohydrate-binding DOMON domain-containing protein